jgi:hypothetical protein
MTIWKFDLETTDVQTVKMPRGAEIIAVQTQRDTPRLWAVVDPKMPLVSRTFYVVGTGHEFTTGNKRYIGTYQLMDGSLVFHVFEGD